MRREVPRRRETRLPEWDYRLPGPYAITMCTQHRAHLFGDIRDGRMVFSAAGSMVNEVWQEMATEFPEVTLDTHVVMPNHVHAILFLGSEDVADNPLLGTVVQRFKAITTSRYAAGVNGEGWVPFDGRLWQRNFYDHIIRDDRDLERCRLYIEANPANWQHDQDNVPLEGKIAS